MISAFGVEHGISKADPVDLGAFREKKRKARTKAFLHSPAVNDVLDLTFKPPPRPEAKPQLRVAPHAPEIPKTPRSKAGLALAGGVAAVPVVGAVALTRKNTRAARWKKR